MYYTEIKHSSHLRTLEKCRKHSPAARAFYISLVFSNACRVLSQCNTRLRLLYLLNKAGSRERGAVWQVIASNLNCHKDLFEVTARGETDLRFSPGGTNQRLLENLKALELVVKNSQSTKY